MVGKLVDVIDIPLRFRESLLAAVFAIVGSDTERRRSPEVTGDTFVQVEDGAEKDLGDAHGDFLPLWVGCL